MTSPQRSKPVRYRGRFAPSPTGPLHFGSLVALAGSYLDARHEQGEWLLRMEDLDPPREIPGAADDILRTIESLGAQWDGIISFQSDRHEHYRQALEQLKQSDAAYPCTCSRREIADQGLPGTEGTIYPGTCRAAKQTDRTQHSWRVRTTDHAIQFDDLVQGRIAQRLESEIGDFIVQRADRLFAYQLAVVVDDAEQQINHVVRGCDLLLSTPRQIFLQTCLSLETPLYLHLPIAINSTGMKLSKHTHAKPIDMDHPAQALVAAMDFLGQAPPQELRHTSMEECWAWGIQHWDRKKIPATQNISSPV